jgi:hypothetical protein
MSVQIQNVSSARVCGPLKSTVTIKIAGGFGAQRESVEVVARSSDNGFQQRSPNSFSAMCGEDVEMTDSADTGVLSVRITVQPANPDYLIVYSREKKYLSRRVEAVNAGGPFPNEPVNEIESFAQTLLTHRLEQVQVEA